MTACGSWWRRSAASSATTTGRSASWSICRDRSCASAPSPAARSMLDKGATFTFDSRSAARRRHARAPAASGNLRGRPARPHAAARRRQDPPARHRGQQAEDRRARRGRRQADRPQGRQPARHRHPVLGADPEGPLRSRRRARRRHRLDRPVVHPAARRHRRGQEDHARPRRRDGQDREAAGGEPARRDHRRRRRADGGARRSRRRNAAREGAGHPEADHPHRAPRRQAGGGGDADARSR